MLCDRRMNVQNNVKVDRPVAAPALVCGADTSALKKGQAEKLDVTEM